jgi:membrane protein DedA with SNARE-associated domain
VELIQRYGLLAVFVSLVTTPVGNPIPEDISLFVAGVLAHMGSAHFATALIVGYLGVTLGDCIAWTMGKKIGLSPTGFMAKVAGSKQLSRIESFYDRWGNWTIVFCRQFPGFRLPCFFFAGASGVPFKRFILVDGSAAIVTTSVFVSLGYTFADDVAAVLPWLDRFRHFAFVLLMLAIGIIGYRIVGFQRAAWKERGRRKAMRNNEE